MVSCHVRHDVPVTPGLFKEAVMFERKKHPNSIAPVWPEIPKFDPGPSIDVGLAVLEELGIPYALAGRVAVWAYVPPREQDFTKDVDFVVPGGSDEAARIAEGAGLETRDLVIFGEKVGKAADGRTVDGESVAIDFLDSTEYQQLFTDATDAAKRETDPRARCPIVPIDYLIVMKLAAGRNRDGEDIKALLPLIKGEDYEQLSRMVKHYLRNRDAIDLDILAREIGHPGPGPGWDEDEYR